MDIERPIDGAPSHVFFTFTPFNQFLVNSLVERPEFADSPVFVVNTSNEQYLNDRVTALNLFDKTYNWWQTIWRYRSVAHTLTTMRSRGRVASVTAPHPHNVFTNDLMLQKSDFPVNVYEDGIANYCASDNVGKLRRQSRVKAKIAPLLGCRFRDYAGHITGIDERVYDSGYFLNPAHVYAAGRFESIVQIDIGMPDQSGSAALQDCVLVLDQDIESLFSARVANELRTNLVSFVKGLGMKIYVKPHPGQRRSDLTRNFGEEAVSIESLKPAEIVALELRPRYLVSFISSALKNVAGMLPGVECYSFGAREFDETRGMNLARVLLDFDVHVH